MNVSPSASPIDSWSIPGGEIDIVRMQAPGTAQKVWQIRMCVDVCKMGGPRRRCEGGCRMVHGWRWGRKAACAPNDE